MKPKTKLKVENYNISGDSMNPFIKKGCSLTINTQLEQFSLGDIVVFFSKGKMIAHRIIRIKPSRKGREYILKGDNSSWTDEIVHNEEIVGRVEEIVFPEYTIDLNTRQNQVVKLLFVLYSRLNLKFPFLLNLRKLYKIPFLKRFYRFLIKT